MNITRMCKGINICFKFLFKRRNGIGTPRCDVGNFVISEVLAKGKNKWSREHYIVISEALHDERARINNVKLTKVRQLRLFINGLFLTLSSYDNLGGKAIKLSQGKRVINIYSETFEEVLRKGML